MAGKTGNRQQNIEINKRLILDAAKATIKSAGIEKMTVRGLAKDAGLDPRTLYNLFGSKEEIILSVLKDEADLFAPAVFENMAKPNLLSLHDLIDSIYPIIESDEAYFRNLIRISIVQNSEDLPMPLPALLDPMFRMWVDIGALEQATNIEVLVQIHVHDIMAKTALWAHGNLDLVNLALEAKHDVCSLLYRSATPETRKYLDPIIEQLEEEMSNALQK